MSMYMSYLQSLNPLLLKNITYIGSLKHFVFFFVFVSVFVFVFVSTTSMTITSLAKAKTPNSSSCINGFLRAKTQVLK